MQGNLSFTKPPKLFSFSVDKELCETDLQTQFFFFSLHLAFSEM